jgi:hypothetical protein
MTTTVMALIWRRPQAALLVVTMAGEDMHTGTLFLKQLHRNRKFSLTFFAIFAKIMDAWMTDNMEFTVLCKYNIRAQNRHLTIL